MVKNSVIKRCVFALSVTTCLTSLDLVYARAPEEISEGLLRNKGVPLSRRYLSSPPKMSSLFEQTRSSQKELIFAQGRLWDSPSMKPLPQNKSLVRLFQPRLQRNDLVTQSFATLMSQTKTLAWFPQPKPQRNTPLTQSFATLMSQSESLPTVFQAIIRTSPRLASLEKKPVTHQAVSPQRSAASMPLPRVPLRSPIVEGREDILSSDSSSVFPLAVRRIGEQLGQSSVSSVSSVISERRQESSLLSEVSSSLQREEERERDSHNSVSSQSEEVVGRSHSLLSSSSSLLPSVVSGWQQSEQNGLGSVSSVISERRQESPLLSEVSSSLQREEERERDSHNSVSSQSEEVVDRSHSLLSSSPSLLSSVIRVSEQPERNGLSSVLSVISERRQESPLISMVSSPLPREEERERVSDNPVPSQREEVVDRSHSLLSSPLSLLPSIVNLSQQSEQNDLSLLSSVRAERHEENSPLFVVSSSLQREQELERGLSTDEDEQQNQVVLSPVEIIEDSSLKAARLREKTLKRAEESMDGLTSDFTEISEALWGNPGVEDLIHQQEKLEILKRKSAEFKQYLYPLDPLINDEFRSEDAKRRVNRLLSRLSDHLGWVEGLELRIQSFLNPRRESFSQVLARRTPGHPSLKLRISSSGSNTITPLQEQERTLEESTEIAPPEKSLHLVLRLRASSSESRPMIPLGESLETGDDLTNNSTEAMAESNPLHLVLRLRASSPEPRQTIPLEESLETGDDSTEAMTESNPLHLVPRLRSSSSGSNTSTTLEEKLESAKEFITNLKTNLDWVAYNLFGNHTEDNLSAQENKLTQWMRETDEAESGLNRLKSTLVQVGEQQQVQTVLNLFDEIDCMWAHLVKRLDFLKPKAIPSKTEEMEDLSSDLSTDNSVDEQLKSLAMQIEGLKNEGSSIDKDLYEDQREDPSPLKGHGEASLNFQEKRLSELQKRARKLGEELMLVSSHVTGEPHSSKRLYLSQVIGEFNDSISSFRQVQSRLNIIRSGTSFLSLETEDPFFSFIPSEDSMSSKKISSSEFSTDFTPEEEFKGLEESTKALKRDLLEFVETLFGEHAVESLKLHETNFLKLQEIANELETRLMFMDSQISKDWQSPHRKQINELMYSFGHALCDVRKAQQRLNFLKEPSSSPSSVVSQVNAPVEEGEEEVLNKHLTDLRHALWRIDGDLYVDHEETNLNLQEEKLSVLKQTLSELEEQLTVLDSQTSKDLQSKEREAVNILLGALSTSQCLFREVEKRLNYLKSPPLRSPVIHLSSGNTVLTPGELTTDEIEGTPSSLTTEDPLAQDLQETEEELSQLGRGLGVIDEDLYIDHTEKNLRFQEEKLSQLKNLLQKMEESLSSLDSKISKDLSSPQREHINSLLGSFSSQQCTVRDLEKRLNHLQTARLLSLDEEFLELEQMLRSFRREEMHIDGELFGNHSMENLSLQEQNLQLLGKKVQKMESRLMELDSEVTKESSPKQREKLEELAHSFKDALCLHAVQSRIETLKKLALSK